MKQTQAEMVLEYIKQFGSISTYDAFLDLGITRLPSRIFDLRQAGYKIDGKMESRKNRFGRVVSFNRYTMEE